MVSWGTKAWWGLACYVTIYDYVAIKNKKETMSAAFGRYLTHPWGKWATIAVVVVLLKHLMAPTVLPQTDPLKYVAEKLRED